MATKKKKQPAAGGGNKASTEPRLQDFKQFSGCNFQLSPTDAWFPPADWDDEKQSDLQQNYLVLQDNVAVTDNSTLETRPMIHHISDQPFDDQGTLLQYTGVSFMAGPYLLTVVKYPNRSADQKLYVCNIDQGGTTWSEVEIDTKDRLDEGEYLEITDLFRADDKLVACCNGKFLMTMPFTPGTDEFWLEMKAPDELPTPDSREISIMCNPGSGLTVSTTPTATCKYQVDFEVTLSNMYGPTRPSNIVRRYFSAPPNEWSAEKWVQISYTRDFFHPEIVAMDVYMAAENASQFAFIGRFDTASAPLGYELYTVIYYGPGSDMTAWAVASLQPPTQDYTAGPPASYGTMIDGRLYFWGDAEHPERIHIGGNPGNIFATAPTLGGGFCDVEPGTHKWVSTVLKYKTQSGASIVTALCSSTNSQREERFNLVRQTSEIDSTNTRVEWYAEQVAGAIGCKSRHGAVVCEDGLYSISRYGVALTTLTMEYNSQIRTNLISDPIKPVFLGLKESLWGDDRSHLLYLDGILYMYNRWTDVIYCYDIGLKAWYTYTFPEACDEYLPLGVTLAIKHFDYDEWREGVLIIKSNSLWLLPTTENSAGWETKTFKFNLLSGELGTAQPLQNWHHLTQIEFNFDYFQGEMEIELLGIDQFGRKVTTYKHIEYDDMQYNLTEWMRVDLKLESYRLKFTGTAAFRLTHFTSKLYPMSSRQGIMWGFDDRQGYRNSAKNDIHPYFKDYNDVKQALIP